MGDDKPGALDWRATLKRRALAAAAVLGLWSAGIEARLVYLQIVQHDELVARAARQQLRTIAVPAKRGEILDRNGRVLAYSVDTDSVYAVPTEIGDPGRAAAALCAALDGCGARDRQAIADRLRRQKAFAYVRRQISPEEQQRIEALKLDGVGFLKENRRFYPNRELAAHLLGYVGIDNQGLHGIESSYDTQIRGRPGKILIQTDARRQAFSRLERPPTSGAAAELTIDQYLQHIAERELRAAVQASRAAGGTVIVMDPHTGEVLAMANEPTFNPNVFARSQPEARRNRAIQDLFEPGSTFKIVTASAALEEHVVSPQDPIDVSDGFIRFGSHQVDDEHRYGVLPFTDVIVKSSNVGAIKVGLALGPERLGRYVRRFGFGQALSRDFPGESRGIVWNPAGLNEHALASMSMGYQIGVTPLQMAAAASAIANGGELVEPRVVRTFARGGARVEVARRVIRRVIGAETAAELTSIMEQVVERGTARAARIDGYTIAGKTGTAAKLVGGRYSTSEYNASFVGFIPSRRPAVTILVVIDSPRGSRHYGGLFAAPVFKRVAEHTLRHLGVGPTINAPPPVLVVRRDPRDAPEPTPIKTPSILPLTGTASASGLMPDLRGLGAREAVRFLARIGATCSLVGDGLIVDQAPAPGTPIDRGISSTLWLRRQPAVVASAGTQP